MAILKTLFDGPGNISMVETIIQGYQCSAMSPDTFDGFVLWECLLCAQGTLHLHPPPAVPLVSALWSKPPQQPTAALGLGDSATRETTGPASAGEWVSLGDSRPGTPLSRAGSQGMILAGNIQLTQLSSDSI